MSFVRIPSPEPAYCRFVDRDRAYWEAQPEPSPFYEQHEGFANTVLPLYHERGDYWSAPPQHNALAAAPLSLIPSEKARPADDIEAQFTKPSHNHNLSKSLRSSNKGRRRDKSSKLKKSKRRHRDPMSSIMLKMISHVAQDFQQQHQQQPKPQPQQQLELTQADEEVGVNGQKKRSKREYVWGLSKTWQFWIMAVPAVVGCLGTLTLAMVNILKMAYAK